MRSKRDTLREGVSPASAAGEVGESVERVTISSLPSSAATASGTGPRRTHTEIVELPTPWLERLLLLWNDLPIAAGERAVARAVVEALAAMLPDHATGLCLVPEGGAQEVFRAGGDGDGAARGGADPARLFPGLTYELVCEVEAGGTTLHVAGDDAACEDPRTSISALASRVAAIAARAIGLARVQARAGGAVAELQSLHAHMVQAEKLASLGQIAAGVVHELNNPLTSIVAYTDWLLRKAGARGPDAHDEMDRLRRIAESAGRMLRFTRDLVSYARPSSETPVPVNVHLVVEQAVAFCEHVIADARVTVVRHLAPSLPAVRGKPEQLAQIFVNLITNASHAMSARGGTLSITTEDEGAWVRVAIADTGHGIAADHLAQVFTPFFTTKTSGAGTGLGLAIVKSIVDGHGGTIDVASRPDHGATFTIRLPASSR